MRAAFFAVWVAVAAMLLGTDAEQITEVNTETEAQTSGELATPVLSLSSSERLRLTDLEARAPQTFSNVDLSDYVALRDKAVTIEGRRFIEPEEMVRLGRRTVGQTFRLNAVQHDPAESDCVVFVNRTIAMTLAKDWESYYRLTERLLHKDGVVEYRNRNFMTLSDWIPNNSWLLEDVTAALGPAGSRPARSFTHLVGPRIFEEFPAAPGSKYTRIIFKGFDLDSPDKQVVTDSYIPAARVREVANELRTGDIFVVLREGAGGHLGCEHVGFIAREDTGLLTIVHSAPPGVRHEPFSVFMWRCRWIKGFKFLRLRSEPRLLATREIERMPVTASVPLPAVQDAKIAAMRARRAQ
jgi:hypothetical protein